MLTSPNPQREFVELLFERLLFERILACGRPNGCCIDPEAMSDKFEFILEYYSHGLRKVHSLRFEVIRNLGLHTTVGVVIHMTNMKGRYKIFPASLEATFQVESENDEEYGHHVRCQALSNKQTKDFNRDFASKVPEAYRDEVELLVSILKANKLISAKTCGKIEPDDLSDDDDDNDNEELRFAENRYVAKLEKTRLRPEVRLRKEQSLITSIKSLTSMEIVVLSSSASGANISDYDIELLLINPTPSPSPTRAPGVSVDAPLLEAAKNVGVKPEATGVASVMSTTELTNVLKKAGYKSVQQSLRYVDTSCDINVPYTTFYDHRSELTCQITLNHPLGVPLRDLIQAYVSFDSRLERLVYTIQQILTEHGRCKKFLSNYAITLMAIAFLQQKKILPKLQHHRMGEGAMSSSGHSAQQNQQQHSHLKQNLQYKPVTQTMSKNQKRANARQNRKLRNLADSAKNSIMDARAAAEDVIHVQTTVGTTQTIDCRFDKVMATNQSFDKQDKSTVGELLLDFLGYFVFEHDFRVDCEISIIDGSLGTMKSNGNPPKPATSTSTNSKQRHLCGLLVTDPFVKDRNVTEPCTTWKIRSTFECFEKAFETLNDGDLGDDPIASLINTYTSSDEDYSDSDESSDSEDEGTDDGTKGSARLRSQRRQQLKSQRQDRRLSLEKATSELIGGMIFLALAAEQPIRS
ncbi:hypothetical protein BGX27_008022 [Mortierella sp. AM989]|nr:hypothetical protein BGX27_008022 [Mortierella sp. AM989]